MIVMDDTSCMVSVARFFMEFCMTESCGKCVPCRAGTVQMFELLTKITKGEATHRDLDRLTELCEVVGATSLCGLGQTAPNPVLSTLRYFKHEYLAHIEENDVRRGCASSARRPRIRAAGRCTYERRSECSHTDGRRGGDQRPGRPDHPRSGARTQRGIPTLCHLEGLSEVGACRLCLVEVKGARRLLPACVTRVEEGMEVTTHSPKIDRYRTMILELFFAERNHICSICVANGNCELQSLALTLGMTHVEILTSIRSCRWTRRIRGSRWTTTAAYCVRGACGCARKSKVRNTWGVMGRGPSRW